MFWLPPLSIGGQSRLPLGYGTAAVIADVLLASDVGNADDRSAWLVALSHDPGLLVWCICRAAEQGADLQTVGQVSDWFLGGGWRTLTADTAVACEDLNVFDSAARDRYADRIVSAVNIAELAQPLAEQAGAVAISEQAYLLGLLSPPTQWFVTEDRETASVEFPHALLRWLSEDSLASHYVRQAKENLKHGNESSTSGDEICRRWLTPVPPWDQQLPSLLNKLSRLAQLENDFQRTLEAEKLESLAEFAAGAGHEINNPLAVISGRAQLLLRQEKNPERRRELAVINGQALRIHEMIADLMLFARPPRPRPATCDLVAILDSIATDFSSRAVESGVTLVRTWPTSGLTLQADPVQMQVALRAICDNALNALSHGGRLEITARQASPSTVQIVLQDNGPGIPPEIRRHLFDPFYSGRGAGRGLGMGLSKCWRIVTQHGGRIDVESTVEQGAKFTITLPNFTPSP